MADEQDIGALWKKTSARGEFFTGTVNGERIVVFANGNKRNEKAPDYRIFKAKPRETPVDDPAF